MGIALTDDHRELAEVARGFLTSQKARAAAFFTATGTSPSRTPNPAGTLRSAGLRSCTEE